VISACFELLDMRRAREWTEALNEWCRAQPGLVAYRGECLIHRAEILRLEGRWPEALDESQRAYDMLAAAKRAGRGLAAYGLAELHRLRGEVPDAEDGYRSATEGGRTPHPGLALLRLAQGQRDAARSAIERALAEPSRGRQRASVLAAAVEILLASGDVGAARRASDELSLLSGKLDSPWLRAMAATAAGAVLLADAEPRQALTPLHEALAIWRDLSSDYEAARVRMLVGRACQALGDADGARLEWEAAAGVFREAGAAPALAEVEGLVISTARRTEEKPAAAQPLPAGSVLTSRELQVLRLIARGKTNKVIARELDISEKTVARHVSNIFTKLDVPTRAAATAYAFTHGLVDAR
jgi:DNA-binding CsgD family transcriptional regulator